MKVRTESRSETKNFSAPKKDRLRLGILMLAVGATTTLGVGRSAKATALFWDGDGNASGNNTSGAGIGGTGTWSTSAVDWWAGTGATSDTTWVSADQAEITGATSTLTLGSAITDSGGILAYVPFTIAGGTNGYALTLAGNVQIGGAASTISAAIAGTGFSSSVGTLVLSGANTFTGTYTLTSGQVNLDNSTALGTANFVITAGAIDTNGQTLANNNTQTWNGNFTFGGSGALNLGSGAVSLGTAAGTARTLTVNGNTFTVGGVISNGTTANSIIKAGAGSLALGGSNTFTGGVTVNAGTLDINNSNAIGTGTLVISAGNIDNTSGSGVALATTNAETWNNDFTFIGTQNLDLGTGAVSLGTAAGTTRTVTVNANTLTVDGVISNGASVSSLTKAGVGTLTLTGSSAFTGSTTVNGGTLSLSGALASPALVLGGGTFSVTSAQAGQSFASGTTLNAAASAIIANYANGNTLGLGAITRNAGATVDFTLPPNGSISSTTANADFTGGQQTILGGYATVEGVTWAVSGTGGTAGAISALPDASYSPVFTAGADVDAAAGTSMPGSMTINSLRFNNSSGSTISDTGSGDTLTIATGGVLETSVVGGNGVTISPLNLTSGNGTDLIVIQNDPGSPLTINSNIIGNISLTKTGSGALVLNGSNTYTGTTYLSGAGSVTQNGNSNLNLANANNSTFTGGLTLNAGQLTYNADNNLGAPVSGITLNGYDTVAFTGTTPITDTHVFTLNTDTTFNVVTAGGIGGKITFSAANLVTGSGNVTKTGPGWLSMGGTNNGTGNWIINAGVVEAKPNSLGSPVSVTVNGDGTTNPNTSGELAANNSTFTNYVILNGGILSGDNGTSTYATGNIYVEANSTIRLGDFYGATNRSLNISGELFGSGNLSLANSLSNVPTNQYLGTTNQILTLSGANSSYSGTLTVDGGHAVLFANTGALVPVIATSTTNAIPIIATNYDLPGNTQTPAVTSSAGTTGVFALGGFSSSGSDSINLATLYGGGWYFGADSNNVSYYGAITPGVDANGVPTYRLGGGDGSLFIGNAKVLQQGTTVTNVVIGAAMIGGTGIVHYGAVMTPTGTTTINTGSVLDMDFLSSSSATNLSSPSSTIILNGGAFTLTGKASTTNVQKINGLTLNPGAGSVQDNANATANPSLLTLGAVTRNVGGTVDYVLPTGTQSTSNGITTTTANTAGTILGGWATVSGANWAVSAGTGSAAGLISALPSGGYSASVAATTAPGATANVDFQASNSTPWASQTINSLRFNTATAGTLTLAGGLTDASGGILLTSTVGANASTITGSTLEGAAGTDLVVIQNDANAAGTLTINSQIVDNTTATGLTKSGAGNLILGSSNTYTGVTNDNAGLITLNNSLALQYSTLSFNVIGGNISFGSLTSATLGGLSGNQYVALGSTGGAVALSVGNHNANTTYSGDMTGLGSLTKIGTGTLTMTGNNSFSGTTTVSSGTLRVNGTFTGAGAVAVNGGGTLGGTGTIAGAVTVAAGTNSATQGSVSLVDGGIGTLTLQNGLTVGDGSNPSNLSFEINAATSDAIALGSSTFNVNAGGAAISITSLVTGSSISSGTTYNLLSFANGTGNGFVTGSGTTVGSLYLANPVLTFGVSGSLNVTSNAVQLVTSVTGAPSTAYWSGVQGSTWSATDPTLTYGNFTTDPGGLNFVNAYPSANTNVIFSAMGNGAPTNLTNTLGVNFDINSLTFLSTNTPATTIGGTQTLTLEGGGITVQSGAGPVTLSMARLVLDASQTWNNSSATPLTVSSNVSGAGGLTTVGSVTMTGTNSYSGDTNVSSGTLQLGGGGSLTSTGNLIVNGTLDVDGSNVTVATLSGAGGIITNGPGAITSATLTTNANADSTYSGTITDSGAGKTLSLVKNGSNSLTLSGSNSYIGSTTVNAGTLVVGNPTALGNGGALLVNGGTLDLSAAGSTSGGAQTISVGSLSGTGGSITDNNGSAGTTTLSVNQTFAGAYTGTLTDGANRPVALSKAGAATLTLTNVANNYSGGTTVSAGQLLSAAPGTVGNGTITLAGGSLSLGTLAGFGGNGSGWKINQTGSYSVTPAPVSANVLTLTDGENNQGRYAFYTAPQSIVNAAGFVANFTYTPSGNRAADGVAFVIENDARGANIINGSGGSLGYTGTNNSGAVEFNIYPGASGGVGTAFGTDSVPANTSVSPVSLAGGDPIQVQLTYSGTTLTEVLTDAVAATAKTTTFSNVEFNSLLNGSVGYVGFTGATGGSSAIQTISNFTFETLAPETWNNNVVAANGVSSDIEVGVASALASTLTMQPGATLDITGGSGLAANTPYGLTFGPTAISTAATFNISNNGTGVGTLTLASLNDGGTASTIVTSGAGALTLGNSAVSIVDGTAVNVSDTSTLNLNASGALGTQADVTVSAGAMLTLGADQTLGSLNGGGSVNINTNSLTVGGTSAINPNSTYSGNMAGTGSFTAGGGNFTLTSAGRIASTNVTIASGAVANINGLLTGAPAVTINGTTTLGANDGINGTTGSVLVRTWGALSVGSGISLNIAPTALANIASRTVLVTSSLNNGGKIDLSDNSFVDQSSTDEGPIVSQLQTGFNAGAWNGASGIVSSTAAADLSHLTALGYDIANGSSPFEGLTPAAGSIEVKYTYYGDANLDGAVDGSDYTLIDNGFNDHLTGWSNGDFNYDGVVDGSDYTLIDNAFNTQSSSLGTNPAALIASETGQIAGSTNAVPEPATLGLLGIGAVGLLRKRRRRN